MLRGRIAQSASPFGPVAGQQRVDPGPGDPVAAATSLTGRFSMVTAVMTSRAFDIPGASSPPAANPGRRAAVLDVLRHPSSMS